MTTLVATNISVEEYLRMDAAAEEKHEYASGEVRAMYGKSIAHNHLVVNLIGEMGMFLKGKGYHVYPSQLRLTTPYANAYFYPDVTIVSGEPQLQPTVFDTLQNPLVIFEVMDEHTERADKGYKFFYYKEIPSLQEYVLINSSEQAIDVIRRQTDDVWKFDSYGPADKQVHLASINCTLTFEDVYFEIHLSKAG